MCSFVKGMVDRQSKAHVGAGNSAPNVSPTKKGENAGKRGEGFRNVGVKRNREEMDEKIGEIKGLKFYWGKIFFFSDIFCSTVTMIEISASERITLPLLSIVAIRDQPRGFQ